MKKIAILGILVLALIVTAVPVLADSANVVRDPSFESNPRAGLHDIRSWDYGFGGGIAEITTADSHSGRQCVLLEATGMDYSRAYHDAQGKKYFSDITGWSFYYKHAGVSPDYNDVTPYIVIVVNIEGGDYDGGELVVVQWNTSNQGYNYNWTQVNDDEWHYLVYDANGDYVGRWGMPGPGLTLAQIQAQYDGTIDRVAVAIGLSSGITTAGVLVDDLEVIVNQ